MREKNKSLNSKTSTWNSSNETKILTKKNEKKIGNTLRVYWDDPEGWYGE